MKKHAVLSATGDDRIGVADELTAALTSLGVEIEESRWTTLQGRFALIVEVCAEPRVMMSLEHDLATLGLQLGYALHMKPFEPMPTIESGRQFRIESSSRGPSGVAAVTEVLKRHGVNIEDLETEATTDSWSSKLMFQMKARVTIPPSCPRSRLREALREVESNRNVDIVFEPRSARSGKPELSSH